MKRASRGITLLEVLLVMALLVAIAAIAAPSLSGPLENHRLRKGADHVRNAWAKARVLAMESGQTYAFRYQPSGNTYVVQPWLTDEDYLESDQINAGGVPLAGTGSTDPLSSPLTSEPAPQTYNEVLPESIYFMASETEADMRAAMLVDDQNNLASLAEWSSPVFFYSDGTTSTARLVLANSRQLHAVVTLRGLTGVTHVSELLGIEELP
jgi:Tfp pilus assembly protein FimT